MSKVIIYTLIMTLTYNDTPLAGQDVLLFNDGVFLGLVKTDENGTIKYPHAPEQTEITALIRIKTKKLVTCLLFKPNTEQDGNNIIKVESLQKLIPVSFKSNTHGEIENYELFIDPVEIEGIPAEYLEYTHFVKKGVKNSYFYKETFTSKEVQIMLPAGCFMIGGLTSIPEHLLENTSSKVISKVKSNGKALKKGDEYTGFEINTSKHKALILEWEEDIE